LCSPTVLVLLDFHSVCSKQIFLFFIPSSVQRLGSLCDIRTFIIMPRRNDVAFLTQQVASSLLWSVLLFSSLCHGGMLDEYFYVQDLNTNSNNVHHHVQEYLATSGTKPNFLYDSNYPNGRIVEFYAHWCPHCQVRRRANHFPKN
jgi:thiol:disulfide interchange protein